MDLEPLKTFSILAKTKSFSKTAKLQIIAQSTVSTRIFELERKIGKKLFVRNNKTVSLTQAGMLFLPYAEKIIDTFETGITETLSTTFFDHRLVIGNVYAAFHNLLSPVYYEYISRYPRVSLRLITGHSTDIVQAWSEGTVDMAIAYQLPAIPGFRAFLCCEEDYVFVVHPRDPLAKRSVISIEEISINQLLYYNWEPAFREWIGTVLPKCYFHANIDQPSFVLSLVQKGMGYAFLTRSAAKAALQEKSVVEIPVTTFLPLPSCKTYMIVHSHFLNHPLILHWLQIMEELNVTITPV